MKVIDLLNKIANGEVEANTELFCKKEKYRHIDDLFEHYYVEEILNDEVQIIGEDKKLEKIKDLNTDYYDKCKTYDCLQNEEIVLDIQTLKHKINEIIDCINKEVK